MYKPFDKETRYYIDLDLKSMKILKWDYDHRTILVTQKMSNPDQVRIYISKGQYNKLTMPETPGTGRP
ncbi:MAG: hypothetical protein A2X22_08115 [Bacteroidetes bacterium GWF2_49_14]|nr:MAG: hypothetical protein A2X22_08115 [Bacteroidetes bacterium GWF2_49_14]